VEFLGIMHHNGTLADFKCEDVFQEASMDLPERKEQVVIRDDVQPLLGLPIIRTLRGSAQNQDSQRACLQPKGRMTLALSKPACTHHTNDLRAC